MSRKSTDTLKYLTNKSIDEVKKEKAPYLVGQIILILLGLILIILGSVEIYFGQYVLSKAFKPIFESVGQALLVGTTISMLLDLPFMQKYYKSRIVDVLVGKEYLNSLPEVELERLRKECTEKIYLKKTNHFEPTLLELDEQISQLLTQPYWSTYRVEITCYKETNHMRKKHSIKYWIENPLLSEASETIDGAVSLYAIDGKQKEDLFKVHRLSVKIDDGPRQQLTDKIDYKIVEGNDETNPTHNYLVRLIEKGTDNNFTFRFKKVLEVEIEDERLVPLNDNVYVKRIKGPTKNFQVHYSVINMDCKLQGACLGTMLGNPLGQVRTVINENSISIESFDWLLPGNGIMIAAIPK